MFRNRPVSLALVGSFLWVTACSTYTQIEPGEVGDHDDIRVTMTNGTKLDLHNPVLEADSLKGEPPHQPDPKYYDAIVYAIPLDQVSALESAHRDAGKSVGAVLLVGAGVVVVVFSVLLIGLALDQ